MGIKYKKLFAISVGLIALISAILIIAGVFQKMYMAQKERLYDDANKNLFESESQNQTIDASSSGNDVQIEWIDFNSKKDVQLTKEFAFKYPSTWKHMGSNDGGSASAFEFYDRNSLGLCAQNKTGSVSCNEARLVARIVISGPSTIPAQREYDEEIMENILVDGYKARKIIGVVKDDTLRNSHVGKSGQKEIGVIVPNVKGFCFEVTAILTKEISEEIFDDFVKSVDFRF